MDYAIKVLQNQFKLVDDLLSETIVKYDNAMIESTLDIEFFETDIFNLKKNKEELTNAINVLRNPKLF